MKRHRFRLRSRLARAMVASAFVSLSIVIIGLATVRYVVETNWYSELSQEKKDAYAAVFDERQVSDDPLETFVRDYVEWEFSYAWRELFMLLGVAAFSGLIVAFLGYRVAQRIARPIEEVAEGARTITQGRLGMNVAEPEHASVEAQELVSAFNDMSAALYRKDQELTASAAAVAHELRTPLTVLRGRLQGMRDGVFEASPESIDSLIAQLDTLSHVTDDLNDLSLMMAGRLTAKVSLVDLAVEARTVLDAIMPDLDDEGFTVEQLLEPAIARVDPARIRQALLAIIENARRYAANGEFLQVEVREEFGWATIRVSDRGPGIALENIERVFDRWWRAEPSRTRAEGGSGLGLAIVRAVAKVHGGEALAENKPDGGVTFTLRFPILEIDGSAR